MVEWKRLYPDHAKLLGNVKDFLLFPQRTESLQRNLNKGVEEFLRDYFGLTRGKIVCYVGRPLGHSAHSAGKTP